MTRYTTVITQIPTAAARTFGVDPKMVQWRLCGGVSNSLWLLTNKTLISKQEQAIKDYIEQFDEQAVSAKFSVICVAANYILAKSHPDPFTTLPQVGENWTRQFLTCNQESHKKKQKLLAVKRKNAHNEDDFKDFFFRNTRVFGLRKSWWMRMHRI